jgi:glycosyltransferase involved in cell wall biosynthesis
MQTPDISIVLPVYNEERNIPLLHGELKAALEQLPRTYQIIYVDDGSRDRSFETLSRIAAQDPTVVVIRLRRNYGQTAALSAGIDHSAGNILILMDADLQNDPADIGRLLAKLDEGYDVVSGWRKKRRDAFFTRKLPSRIANGLISRVTGVRLHDYGCTLKAYRREVIEDVHFYGEMHRFIPVFASWNGAQITELPVHHRKRKYGRSKYGLARTMRVILDLLLIKFLGSYATKPHYAFGYVGMLLMFASFAAEAAAIGQRLLPPYVRMHNNPLTLLGAVLLVLAIQVVMMGLIAELIMRTYYESQDKRTYLIRTILAPTTQAQTAAPVTARRYGAAGPSEEANPPRRSAGEIYLPREWSP